MSIVYKASKPDIRHKHIGFYVDVDGSFHDPVGPFGSANEAAQFVEQNKDRLVELYGENAGKITHQ